jgi:hypothetical protein
MTKLITKQIQDKVEVILSTYPQARDNDNLLIATYWHSELFDTNIKASQFFRKIADGEMTSTESICRARRKAQEQTPHLRGEKWKLRHEKADEVRRELSKSRRYNGGEVSEQKGDYDCRSQMELIR